MPSKQLMPLERSFGFPSNIAIDSLTPKARKEPRKKKTSKKNPEKPGYSIV